MASTYKDDARCVFPLPLYADYRTDWEVIDRFGLEMNDERRSQCKILCSSSDPEDKGAIFFYLCSKLPYSVFVTHLGKVYSIMDLVSAYGYEWIPFKYRNTFILHIQKNVEAKPYLETILREERKCRTTVYLNVQVMMGNLKRIKVGEAEPFHGGLAYPWGDVDYVVQVVDFTLDTYPLDECLRLQIYLKLYADSWMAPEFRNVDYYRNPSYAMWSLVNHQKQWLPILSSLSKDSVLVAPGDGVGVISMIWHGEAVCGDAIKISSSHERVIKESISETIRRSEGRPNRVFVLSYVYDFLTEVDWLFIERTGCPVIIMDFKDHVREGLGKIEVIGKGIVGYRVKGLISFVREDRDYIPKMLYSENLLNLNNILVLSPSYPIDYLLAIAPNKQYYAVGDAMIDYVFQRGGNVQRYKGQEVTPLVNSIDELIPILHLRPYFAPIGRIVTEFKNVDISRVVTLQTRIVYTTILSEVNKLKLVSVPHVIHGFQIFFFCTDAVRQEFNFNFACEGGVFRGSITFADAELGKLRVEEDPIRVHINGLVYTLGDPPLLAQNIAMVIPYEEVSLEMLGLIARFVVPKDLNLLMKSVSPMRWSSAAKGIFPVDINEMIKEIKSAILIVDRRGKEKRLALSVVMQQGWDTHIFGQAINLGVDQKWWKRPKGKYLLW